MNFFIELVKKCLTQFWNRGFYALYYLSLINMLHLVFQHFYFFFAFFDLNRSNVMWKARSSFRYLYRKSKIFFRNIVKMFSFANVLKIQLRFFLYLVMNNNVLNNRSKIQRGGSKNICFRLIISIVKVSPT